MHSHRGGAWHLQFTGRRLSLGIDLSKVTHPGSGEAQAASFPDPGTVRPGLGTGQSARPQETPGAPSLLQGHEAPTPSLGSTGKEHGGARRGLPRVLSPTAPSILGPAREALRTAVGLPIEGALAAALSPEGWEPWPQERGKRALHHQHQVGHQPPPVGLPAGSVAPSHQVRLRLTMRRHHLRHSHSHLRGVPRQRCCQVATT